MGWGGGLSAPPHPWVFLFVFLPVRLRRLRLRLLLLLHSSRSCALFFFFLFRGVRVAIFGSSLSSSSLSLAGLLGVGEGGCWCAAFRAGVGIKQRVGGELGSVGSDLGGREGGGREWIKQEGKEGRNEG